MQARGWEQCDIIIVTGDAYVDHPAFGPVLIARFLEGRGFKVGLIPQPDWHSAEPFKALGPPRIFFGVTTPSSSSTPYRACSIAASPSPMTEATYVRSSYRLGCVSRCAAAPSVVSRSAPSVR